MYQNKIRKNPSEYTNKPFKIMYNNSEFTMVKFLNKGLLMVKYIDMLIY